MSIATNTNEVIWSQKYRPSRVSDCVLTQPVKETLQSYVGTGVIPNIIFDGPPGTGKTTSAMALCAELDANFILINGATDGVDKFRTDITQFASSMSMFGGSQRKVVILDEAENLSAAMQNALKTGMEEFSATTSFILTCNHVEKIIEPIHSRCPVIDFRIPKGDIPALGMQITKRACLILTEEGISFDKALVRAVVGKYFPDFRRIINVLQRYSSAGSLSQEALDSMSDEALDRLMTIIKDKKFTEMTKWVVESSASHHSVMSGVYVRARELMQPIAIAELIDLYSDIDYRMAFVVDKDITLMSFLKRVMEIAKWK